jgi:hypothetical protein
MGTTYLCDFMSHYRNKPVGYYKSKRRHLRTFLDDIRGIKPDHVKGQMDQQQNFF